MHQLDLRKKKAEDVFRKNEIKAVIHMGIMHDPRMSEEEHHSLQRGRHHAPARVLRQVRREEGGGPLLGQRLRP